MGGRGHAQAGSANKSFISNYSHYTAGHLVFDKP